MPVHFDGTERDTYIPCLSMEGELKHGTMVLRYTKETIYVILPGSVYGMKLMPMLWFIGWCPICHSEIDAAHVIHIQKEVQKQEDICMECQTPSRPNPLFFPQAIALYDDELDGVFISTLPKDYIDDCIKIAKDQAEGH